MNEITRREFVKVSATGLAAAWAFPASGVGASPVSEDASSVAGTGVATALRPPARNGTAMSAPNPTDPDRRLMINVHLDGMEENHDIAVVVDRWSTALAARRLSRGAEAAHKTERTDNPGVART